VTTIRMPTIFGAEGPWLYRRKRAEAAVEALLLRASDLACVAPAMPAAGCGQEETVAARIMPPHCGPSDVGRPTFDLCTERGSLRSETERRVDIE
jgi:hypothetical protein